MDARKIQWRDPALGRENLLHLPQGPLRYHDAGEGPPVVFVHGALVNANLWARVVEELSGSHRCIALELPLGSHRDPMPEAATLTPPAIADLIADAIAEIGLDRVTLVGNDTGGALCQIVAANRPERLDGLVLTSCDAFDNFPPKAFRPFMAPLRIPGAMPILLAPSRLGFVVRPIFATLAKQPIPKPVMDSWVLPPLASGGVRRDLRKLLGGVDSRYTLEAAERLRDFDRPALIAFSTEDKFFPRRHAVQLAELIPEAKLEWIEDARTFSAIDQPTRLAELIGTISTPGELAGANDRSAASTG